MTPQEAAALLTICAGFDNRKPDADQAKAWSLALHGLRFIDCRDAIVRHYQRTREWIMPFDVIKGVKKVRSQRVLEHFDAFQPADGLSDEEYARWYTETVEAIGDGDLTRDQAPVLAVGGANVVRELESRGLRVNTVPVERVRPYAEQAREAARIAKAERQATTKPDPEPLLTDTTRSREPVTTPPDQPEESA